jgi:hypothetical protein
MTALTKPLPIAEVSGMADAIVSQHHPIISRAEAKALGLKRYFTGKSCKSGHVSERLAVNGSCMHCMRDKARAAYATDPSPHKAWYAANRETELVKASERSKRKRREANPDRYDQYHVAVRARSHAKSSGLTRYFTGKPCKHGHLAERFTNTGHCVMCVKAWALENPEKYRDIGRAWVVENPEKRRLISRAGASIRRARKRAAEGSYTPKQIRELSAKQRHCCAEPSCRKSIKKEYHIDHVMPLALGGSNWITNIQLLCPTCNMRKRAKDPITWAQENGRLL